MNKAVFLDRDRTINEFEHKGVPEDPDSWNYILKWEDFKFIPEAVAGMKLLQKAGYKLIVVSNQSCVNRQGVDADSFDIENIFSKMEGELWFKEQIKASWYFCPHDPETESCSCRKPEPGMIYAAAFQHDVDLAQSWMVGDRITDMQAGYGAGIRKLILVGDRPSFESRRDSLSFVGARRVPHVLDAALYILNACNADNKASDSTGEGC